MVTLNSLGVCALIILLDDQGMLGIEDQTFLEPGGSTYRWAQDVLIGLESCRGPL